MLDEEVIVDLESPLTVKVTEVEVFVFLIHVEVLLPEGHCKQNGRIDMMHSLTSVLGSQQTLVGAFVGALFGALLEGRCPPSTRAISKQAASIVFMLNATAMSLCLMGSQFVCGSARNCGSYELTDRI